MASRQRATNIRTRSPSPHPTHAQLTPTAKAGQFSATKTCVAEAMQPAALGLSDFLAEYRLARAPGAGLKRFLSDYHRSRAQLVPSDVKQRPPPDPVLVATFFNALHGACAAERTKDLVTNIWSIAGLKRNEVRTTAVLAWALDHRQKHGFGDAVLSALLESLQGRVPDGLRLGSTYRVRTEYCVFGASEDRIDIAIEGENCVIFIEAKIDASEGDQQIERYSKKAKDRASYTLRDKWCIIYLSRSRQQETCRELIYIIWPDIAEAIETAIRRTEHPSTFSAQALLHFATHLRQL